ncbi:MAG: type II secretion system inner membrane protein GspF [Pantoea sp.]|nr:type II secretion system inner membrane protein GspF [Pantoea sp.]
MAKFHYQALTATGKQHQGSLIADNLRDARQQLREKGLVVLTLKEREAGRFQRSKRLSSRDIALATRQLATLVAASLPLDQALQAVAQQSEKKEVRHLFQQLKNSITEGHSLASAFGAFPTVFNRMYCAMIAAGELSGHLPLVLQRLAVYEEQRQKLKAQLMQVTIYPLVLTLVACSVVTILLVAVVPKVVEQFITMQQALPMTTQILLLISDFLRAWGIWIALAIGLLALANRYWLKTPERLLKRHQQHLRWPLAGRLIRVVNTARYARTLSILNSSAVPLLDAMRISASVIGNEYARQLLSQAEEKVREGESFYLALQRTHFFSPMMLQMIAAGEQSGRLDEMLERSADLQEEQLSQQIALALGLFEPVLVVTMASVVLFIILAILQPILQMNEMIG